MESLSEETYRRFLHSIKQAPDTDLRSYVRNILEQPNTPENQILRVYFCVDRAAEYMRRVIAVGIEEPVLREETTGRKVPREIPLQNGTIQGMKELYDLVSDQVALESLRFYGALKEEHATDDLRYVATPDGAKAFETYEHIVDDMGKWIVVTYKLSEKMAEERARAAFKIVLDKELGQLAWPSTIRFLA